MRNLKFILQVATVVCFAIAAWLNSTRVFYAGWACFAASLIF